MFASELRICSTRLQQNLISRVQSSATATLSAEENHSSRSSSSDCVTVKPYSDIPSPRGIPLFGNFFQMLSKENKRNSHIFFGGLRDQLGDIFRMKLINKELVFICSPEDSRTLYTNDGMLPMIPGFENLQEIRMKSLSHLFPIPGLLSQGEPWREFRSAVQQDLMRPRSALHYINELNKTTSDLCHVVQESLEESGETCQLNLNLQKFALEASGIMFIGSHLGVLSNKKDSEVDSLMAAVSVLISKLQLVLNLPISVLKINGDYYKLRKCMTTIYEICNKKIQEAIERDKQDNNLEGTVLRKLIDRCGKDSPIPTVMAVDSIAAGIDTTAHTASFLLYHLATNPEKQEMLYDEICRVVGKSGDMTESKMAEMRYLKACQMESQRIAPIANGTARVTQQDLVLSGYHVPKNTTVIRVGILSSNNEKYYKDPEKFLPERWIRGCPHNQKVDPYTNLPFGHGPRACIGQRFAKLELYMVAFRMVQKYRLQYDHEPIQIDYTGVGKPDRELKIKLTPRQ